MVSIFIYCNIKNSTFKKYRNVAARFDSCQGNWILASRNLWLLLRTKRTKRNENVLSNYVCPYYVHILSRLFLLTYKIQKWNVSLKIYYSCLLIANYLQFSYFLFFWISNECNVSGLSLWRILHKQTLVFKFLLLRKRSYNLKAMHFISQSGEKEIFPRLWSNLVTTISVMDMWLCDQKTWHYVLQFLQSPQFKCLPLLGLEFWNNIF